MRKKTFDRRNRRYTRWSLRYKGFELATIECLGFFKLTNANNDIQTVSLVPLNDAARREVEQLAMLEGPATGAEG